MLRGCRWQLALFLLACLVLAGSLIWRSASESDRGSPDDSPAATPTGFSTTAERPATSAAPGVPADNVVGIPTFREGLVGSLSHLNPLLAAPGSLEAEAGELIFEGLMRINSHGETVPALADRLRVTDSGLEYVFTLRDDVLWQDGVPFSAADVDFTLSLLQARDFPGDPGLGRFWRTVEVDVLAANVLRFRLSQPLGSFPDRLTFPVLPWHALEGTPAARLPEHPFNWSPVGTGRWQLEALRLREDGEPGQVDLRQAPTWLERGEAGDIPPGSRLRLELFARHEDARLALASGTVDGLAARTWQEHEALVALADEAPLRLALSTAQGTGMLIFNWQHEGLDLFRDQRVRLALVSGMDREMLVTNLLDRRAVVANSPLWPGTWAWTEDLDWPDEDLDAARWLLQEARSRRAGEAGVGSPAPTPQFRILTRNEAPWVDLARAVAGQWNRVDVEASVDARPDEAYWQALQDGDFDVALVEFSAGHSTDPDVYAFWHVGQYPEGLNFGGVDDRRIAELLERARREPWGVNRVALYREFQQTFAERAIAIPLYYPLVSYATGPGVGSAQLGRTGVTTGRFATLQVWPARTD